MIPIGPDPPVMPFCTVNAGDAVFGHGTAQGNFADISDCIFGEPEVPVRAYYQVTNAGIIGDAGGE